MAEFSMPFDSVEIEPNVYDREYNALEFAEYLGGLVETGVMRGRLDEFNLRNTGDNMQTYMSTGIAYIGIGEAIHYYKNDSELTLTHDTESIGLNRIDRIVLRLDLNTNERQIKAHIKKGVAAANPVAPTLQRDNMIYELSIGRVYIVGGQTYIDSNAISYEVGNRTLCPFVTSNILPYIDESLELVKFKNDYAYQIPVVFGDTICLQRASDVQRLLFKLDNTLTGNPIKISLDDGVTSVPLKKLNGTQVTRIASGFIEIYDNTDFFTLVSRGNQGQDTLDSRTLFLTTIDNSSRYNKIGNFMDELYFYTFGNGIFKLDKKTGNVIASNSSFSSALIVGVDDSFIYVISTNKLYKLNKNTLAVVSVGSDVFSNATKGFVSKNSDDSTAIIVLYADGTIRKFNKSNLILIASSSASIIYNYMSFNSSLVSFSNDCLLAWNNYSNLLKISLASLTVLDSKSGLGDYMSSSMLETPDGYVYYLYNPRLYRIDPSSMIVKSYNMSDYNPEVAFGGSGGHNLQTNALAFDSRYILFAPLAYQNNQNYYCLAVLDTQNDYIYFSKFTTMNQYIGVAILFDELSNLFFVGNVPFKIVPQ